MVRHLRFKKAERSADVSLENLQLEFAFRPRASFAFSKRRFGERKTSVNARLMGYIPNFNCPVARLYVRVPAATTVGARDYFRFADDP